MAFIISLHCRVLYSFIKCITAVNLFAIVHILSSQNKQTSQLNMKCVISLHCIYCLIYASSCSFSLFKTTPDYVKPNTQTKWPPFTAIMKCCNKCFCYFPGIVSNCFITGHLKNGRLLPQS